MQKGTLIVAGNADNGEEYLCQLLCDRLCGHVEGLSPLVRVRLILRYPRQRALYWPEQAAEIPPLPCGAVCRLPLLRQATREEAGRFSTYAESLEACQREALREAQSEREREILLRHMAGDIGPRRTVKFFKRYEWRREMDD